ncbi:MAG TPA: hypothetical protein VEF53_15490, partial [Patescibacteria group bacterium]|nr:hypothetical protein [Patescibacteria group bacterium]
LREFAIRGYILDKERLKNGTYLEIPPSVMRHTTLRSIKKLSRYEIEMVVCNHGGLFHGNASRRIAEITSGV